MPKSFLQMIICMTIVQLLSILPAVGCNESDKAAEIRALFGDKSHPLHTITINDATKSKYLIHLNEIKELRKLNIGGAWVTPTHLKQVANITQLEELNLNSVKLAGDDLQPIQQLTNLQRLKIFNAPELDDAVFVVISKLKLTSLAITGTLKLQGSNIHHIVNCESILALDLNGNSIGDDATNTLSKMMQLKRLNITHTKITEVGVKRLLCLVNLDDYQGPDLLNQKAIEYAKLAIAERQKARSEGKTTAPDNLAPYASSLEK